MNKKKGAELAMSFLKKELEIRETCQVYRVLIDQLLNTYSDSNGKKTLLSCQELQAAILICSLSRDPDGNIYISKSSFRSKLNCGKNEHTRILNNLFIAGIIEKNTLSDDFTYIHNNRYIHLRLNKKWYSGKKIQKRGYIHLTKYQVEEILRIKKVISVRLAIYTLAELHKKATQTFTSGGKTGRKYKNTQPVCSISLQEIRKICGRYVKYKNLILTAIQSFITLFKATIENGSVIVQYQVNVDYETYYRNKQDFYYNELEAEFKNEIDNINLEVNFKSPNAKMHEIDLQNEILETLTSEAFRYGIDFVKQHALNIFSHFLTTTDRLQKPAHYILATLANEKKNLQNQEQVQEEMLIAQRTSWRNYKRNISTKLAM